MELCCSEKQWEGRRQNERHAARKKKKLDALAGE